MTYRTNDLETENKSLREKVAELESKLKTIQERHLNSLHKWEYTLLGRSHTSSDEGFNELAVKGWEFICFKEGGQALFKRPLPVSRRPIPEIPDSD